MPDLDIRTLTLLAMTGSLLLAGFAKVVDAYTGLFREQDLSYWKA